MSLTESKLKVQIVQETQGLGAVVVGVDTRDPLGAELIHMLKEAILRCKVRSLPRLTSQPLSTCCVGRTIW
jgi:alpha-ketoglutarate-dependent taurine dioxygenase